MRQSSPVGTRPRSGGDRVATGNPKRVVYTLVGNRSEASGVVNELPPQAMAAPDLIREIQAGLDVDELEDLRIGLDLPMEKLAPKLGISRATLHRRKATGKLDPGESDRVVRFARLLGKAIGVFESEEYARKWLNAPQTGLGNAVPLDYATTEVGAREVEDLLGRIDYGVYS